MQPVTKGTATAGWAATCFCGLRHCLKRCFLLFALVFSIHMEAFFERHSQFLTFAVLQNREGTTDSVTINSPNRVLPVDMTAPNI